jgi:hypothetical protein
VKTVVFYLARGVAQKILFLRRIIMTHIYDIKRRMLSAVIGLIIASAIIISCEDVNGPGVNTAENGVLTLSESRAHVVGIDITSVADLELIGNDPGYPLNGNYVLTTDLVLTQWIPIGYPTPLYIVAPNPFTGTFDGAGHTITIQSYDNHLFQNFDNLGLFAVIGNGSSYPLPAISNLTVELETETLQVENAYIGGLTGSVNTAQFDNITIDGNLAVDLVGTAGTYDVGGVAGFAQQGVFTNNTVTADLTAVSNLSAAPVINLGGVAGLAQSAAFSNIDVIGEYTGIYSGNAPAPAWKLVKVEEGYRAQGVAVPGSDGVNVGGVAGHADNSQFAAIGPDTAPNALKITVNAVSSNGPVYAGGVVGFASGATITTSRTRGTVTGNGPGYNTSAGGIAGYILASRISDSSSSCAIDLTGLAPGAFTDYNTWQVYAGGLAGYVGGSDAAPSAVTHSYATGSVTATSPYPYAGGLIGYLYGYSDFVSPAKNGSTVSRSWATGSVSATAQDDPAGVNDNIPYSGGLVGYSSVTGSTIVDSYARGNVTATTNGTFAWAGGLVGGNANNAVVIRTYATGDVTVTAYNLLPPSYPPLYAAPGPAGGSIAGVNYYTTSTSVSYSVGLSRLVNGNQSTTQNVLHRVVGSLGDGSGHDGILSNNYAYDEMAVVYNWQQDPFTTTTRDGANTVAQPAQAFYTGLNWDFNTVWTIAGDGYPALR